MIINKLRFSFGGHQRIRTAVAAFAELSLTARPGDHHYRIGCKYRAFFLFYADFFLFQHKIYLHDKTDESFLLLFKLPIILRGCCFCCRLVNKRVKHFMSRIKNPFILLVVQALSLSFASKASAIICTKPTIAI